MTSLVERRRTDCRVWDPSSSLFPGFRRTACVESPRTINCFLPKRLVIAGGLWLRKSADSAKVRVVNFLYFRQIFYSLIVLYASIQRVTSLFVLDVARWHIWHQISHLLIVTWSRFADTIWNINLQVRAHNYLHTEINRLIAPVHKSLLQLMSCYIRWIQ